MSYIQATGLEKHYGLGETSVMAVRGMSLGIESGEFIGIMGESGSGKSTLLSMLGGLNSPTAGRYVVDDIEVYSLTQDQLADFRREFIGFVFQSFHLVPYLTVLENVILPLVPIAMRSWDKRALGKEALKRVGLADKANRLPNQISGGEQERVAVARAVVNEPPILLADEPTGNLDTKTSGEIMDLLQGLNSDGMTIVMVTHSPECVKYARRLISVSDGLLLREEGSGGQEESMWT
jgi:putative ABC transport system ATP-binding protein